MKSLLWHKFDNQEIFSTPGLKIQIGKKNPKEIKEILVEDNKVKKVLTSKNCFTIKGGKLVDKKLKK